MVALPQLWLPILVSAVIVFVASLSTLSVIGTEFVPAEDRGEFVVNVEVPPGTEFEQTVKYVEHVETVVKTLAASAIRRSFASKAAR